MLTESDLQGDRVIRALRDGVVRGYRRNVGDCGSCGICELDAEGERRFLAGEALPLRAFDLDRWGACPDGPCLVRVEDFNDEDEDLMGFPPPKPLAVAGAIRRMYLGHCEDGDVTAVSTASIRELLPVHQPMLESAVRWPRDLPRSAFRAVHRDDDYCGRSWVCICGEPGCGSEFSWKRAGSLMLHFSMYGGGLLEVLMLPRLSPIPDPPPL